MKRQPTDSVAGAVLAASGIGHNGGPPILYGADEIGAFLFPHEPSKKRQRRIYHLVNEVPAADRLPVFRMGDVICGRPPTLLNWIAEREGRACGAA